MHIAVAALLWGWLTGPPEAYAYAAAGAALAFLAMVVHHPSAALPLVGAGLLAVVAHAEAWQAAPDYGSLRFGAAVFALATLASQRSEHHTLACRAREARRRVRVCR